MTGPQRLYQFVVVQLALILLNSPCQADLDIFLSLAKYNHHTTLHSAPLCLNLPVPGICHKEGIHFVTRSTSRNIQKVRIVAHVVSGLVPCESPLMGTSSASTRNL